MNERAALPKLLLSIESSCDETAAAIVSQDAEVWSDVVFTQAQLHAPYGGVVPEIASRDHLRQIVPVIERALEEAQVTWSEIDAIAVTSGPGLVGSLLVGVEVAKGLALTRRKALVPVNHLFGHLSAVRLHRRGEAPPEVPVGPQLALVISGGHSAIYHLPDGEGVELLAQTRDDAAGEAFDKVARLLGLGYPGGPLVEAGAEGGDPERYPFPIPRFKDADCLSFSFSGLKTAVLTELRRQGSIPEGQDRKDLLASFQRAVCAQLLERCRRALQKTKTKQLTLVGGVACNQKLRETLRETLARDGVRLFTPPPRWCTDNAAMIGAAAWRILEKKPEAALTGIKMRRLPVRSVWSHPRAGGGR